MVFMNRASSLTGYGADIAMARVTYPLRLKTSVL